MRENPMLQGALILMGASLITKILGFANSIILSRTLGAEGIGIIMMVTPIMGLMMTLTSLGLPLAVAKMVAEADAHRNDRKIKLILTKALSITTAMSLLLLGLMLFLGRSFTTRFLTDQRSYYSLMAMVPVIPILAVSGVLRGYFQGKQNMTPLATAQVLEQVFRIALVYTVVKLVMPYGLEIAAAAAVLCSVLGEAISLIYLAISFRRHSKSSTRSQRWIPPTRKQTEIVSSMLRIGLPMTGSGLIRSAMRVIQPIIISQSLILTGLETAQVSAEYGMLTGYVMPLLFFPGFVNHSLGVSLVPAISEAASRKNKQLVWQRILQAVRISVLVGIPSTAILYFFAHPILTIVYQAPEAAPLLQLIAPFFFFQYFHTPLQSALVGLGQTTIALLNNIVPKIISLILIYPLSYLWGYGIYGVGIALSIGVVLETISHFVAVTRLVRR